MRAVILAAGRRQLAPLDYGASLAHAEQWTALRTEFPAVRASRAAEVSEQWATRLIARGLIKAPAKGCRACPVRLTRDNCGEWVQSFCVQCEMKAIRREIAALDR